MGLKREPAFDEEGGNHFYLVENNWKGKGRGQCGKRFRTGDKSSGASSAEVDKWNSG